MSSKQKRPLPVVILNVHRMATQFALDLAKLFSKEICAFVSAESIMRNTSVELVFGSLLSNTAALLGNDTTLKLNEHYAMGPNFFLLLVAQKDVGKSQAYTNFCQKPLNRLQSAFTEEKAIYLDDFTKAGMLTLLQENKGYGYLCQNELCHALVALFKGNAEEAVMFRSLMNKLFSGEGYRKEFATKHGLHFDKSALTICGTSQPTLYYDFLEYASNIDDGFCDRFLTLHCPEVSPDPQLYGAVPATVSVDRDWPIDVVKRLYDIHQSGTATEYRLSKEALDHFNSIKEAKKAEQRERFETFLRVLNEASTSSAAPSLNALNESDDVGSAKELDIALKLALSVHVTTHMLNAVMNDQLKTVTIPAEIDIRTLSNSIDAVYTLRRQQKLFTDLQSSFKTQLAMGTSGASNLLVDKMMAKHREETLQMRILLFPGKFVTTKFLTRKTRGLKADPILQAMKAFAQDSEGKDLGTFKHFNNINCFYKAPPASLKEKETALQKFGVRLADYEAAFNTDMTAKPSWMDASIQWDDHYSTILGKSPYKYD